MRAFRKPVTALPIRLTSAVAACRFITVAGAQAGADSNALGVSRAAGSSGELGLVDIQGTAVIESGAAIAANATLKSDSSGRAITWVTSGAKVAIALEAASAAGQLIEVLILQNVA